MNDTEPVLRRNSDTLVWRQFADLVIWITANYDVYLLYLDKAEKVVGGTHLGWFQDLLTAEAAGYDVIHRIFSQRLQDFGYQFED